jgi:hypothetical protein
MLKWCNGFCGLMVLRSMAYGSVADQTDRHPRSHQIRIRIPINFSAATVT